MSLYFINTMLRLNIEPVIAFWIGAFLTVFLVNNIIWLLFRSSIAVEHQCQDVTSFQEPVSFWASAAHGFIGALFKSLRHTGLRGDALDDVIFPRFLKYGYTHRVHDWGFNRLWTADSENIQVLLKGNFTHYNKGSWLRNGFSPVVRGGLVSSDGEQWEKSRKRVAPHFNGSHITDVSTLEPHMQAMFNEFASNGVYGWTKNLDIWKVCSSFSMGSTVDFVFGSSSNPPSYLADNLHKNSGEVSMMDSLSACLLGGLMRFRAGPLYWMVYPHGFKAACLATKAFANSYISEALHRRNNGISRFHEKHKQPVFVDSMASCIEDPMEICDEALTLLFAGQESTGGLIAFSLILLSRHEDVFLRLRADVLAEFGEHGPITAGGILRVPYLRWVLNEVLRLYTIFPILTRQANQDTILPKGGGLDGKSPIFVPKGQVIIFVPYVLHRREDIWGSDATSFNPSRWKDLKPSSNFIPFSGGPRKCVGMQFGLSKTSFAIIRILQQYSKVQTTCGNDDGEVKDGNAKIPKHLGFSLMPKKFSVRFFRDK